MASPGSVSTSAATRRSRSAVSLIEEAWRELRPLPDRAAAARRATGGAPARAAAGSGRPPSEEAIADAARALDESLAQPRPRYFAFIGSSGLEIGVIADALAACYDVNLAVWAGAASEVELQAVRWAGEFVGFPAEAGSFTSGGTVSNLTALTAARERALPGRAARAASPAAGSRSTARRRCTTPSSGPPSCSGSARRWVRALPIDGERRLRPDAVAAAIDADRGGRHRAGGGGRHAPGRRSPAPSTRSTSSPTSAPSGASGCTSTAPTGCRPRGPPTAAHLFRGLERADSVAIDAHKWLYLPEVPAASCSSAAATTCSAALGHEGEYLPHDRQELHAADITLEYSRPFRALKFWLALRVHGADAFTAAIERNLGQARLLHDAVVSSARSSSRSPAPPQLSVVPFRHVPPGVADVDAHNCEIVRRIQEGGEFWVARPIDGRIYVRPCIVNFRTRDDVLAFVEQVERIGRVAA